MKEIDYVPESIDTKKMDAEEKKRFEKISDMPLLEQIKLFDASVDKTTGNIVNKDYWLVLQSLRDLFNFATPQDVNAGLSSVKDIIEDTEAKMRNHRHENTKQYSSRPEF